LDVFLVGLYPIVGGATWEAIKEKESKERAISLV
jgi:hypothetical protein